MRAALTGCAFVAAVGAAATAAAQPLIADLSSHLITITSSYTGTELLLFGTAEEEGEIVVVVRGPPRSLYVRRKERVGGIWMNRASELFSNVPGYYAVAATRPLGKIATDNVLTRLGIGTRNLRFEASTSQGAEFAAFREALVRNLTRNGLFPAEIGVVTRLGGRLFRSAISFPANAPVGNYTAEVYLMRDNQVVTAQTTPLYIRKTGLEREVFEFSRQFPLIYGLAAVIVAAIAGWLAEFAFRRR